MRRKSSESGFSLIETLVVLGIMGVATLGVSSILLRSISVSNNFSSQIGVVELSKSMQEALKTNSVCNSSLGSINFDPGAAATPEGIPFALRVADQVVTAPMDLPNFAVRVEKLQLASVRYAGQSAAGNPLYYGAINLTARKLNESDGGQEMRPRTVATLILEVNSSNQVQGCFTSPTPQATCGQLGGTYNPAATPPCDITTHLHASSCPGGNRVYANGIDADGNLICSQVPNPTWRFPNHPNPCDDSVTLTYFRSTCDGRQTTPGQTCVWYDQCRRFDAGSGGATAAMRNTGFTIVDLPGNRYSPTLCSGPDNEDGYACVAHIENAAEAP